MSSCKRPSVGGKAMLEVEEFERQANRQFPGSIPDLSSKLSKYLGLFTAVDADGSGTISLHELLTSEDMSAHLVSVRRTAREMEELLDVVDVDGNRQLDRGEFFNLMLLLEGAIPKPIDPEEAPEDKTRGVLHLSISLEPHGSDFLLRVRDVKLHLPKSQKVHIRVNLLPQIVGRNTPIQQQLREASPPAHSTLLAWDTILAWSIPHTENLAKFCLCFSAFKHRPLRKPLCLGAMTIKVTEATAVKPVDDWFMLLDPLAGIEHCSRTHAPAL